ncbi:hypothetical protein ACET3Z_009576 [Daucus carota]
MRLSRFLLIHIELRGLASLCCAILVAQMVIVSNLAKSRKETGQDFVPNNVIASDLGKNYVDVELELLITLFYKCRDGVLNKAGFSYLSPPTRLLRQRSVGSSNVNCLPLPASRLNRNDSGCKVTPDRHPMNSLNSGTVENAYEEREEDSQQCSDNTSQHSIGNSLAFLHVKPIRAESVESNLPLDTQVTCDLTCAYNATATTHTVSFFHQIMQVFWDTAE